MRVELKPSVCVFFALMAAFSAALLGWPHGLWAAAAITASVLLHEFGHALVARCFGIRVKVVGMSLKGGYTVRERSDRLPVEAMTALAGPAVNLLLFTVFFLSSGKMSGWIALSNFVLAATNLLPIGPSDGMRALRLFMAR